VNTAAPFTVLNVLLDSGERLPCLVEAATWIPVRVATRWAVRYRRYRVQSSTLANNLKVREGATRSLASRRLGDPRGYRLADQ
jgi:hypothetical protein